MRRILKLNQHYILSIKNGSEISKYYHYREVRRIWIEKGNDEYDDDIDDDDDDR
jgi:hypothetical protein